MERQSRVLVVDDDPFALRGMARVLEGESYQVVTAASGSEAIDLLEQDSFDLVLTDLRMPEVDGLEVLRRAREIAPQAVVLILAGYAALESAAEALREGAYDYLVKPCSADELKLKVERGLERIHLAEERQRAEEEVLQRTAQLEALRQVGLEITAELDLDALLHSIASRAIKLVRGTSGGLYLYRPNQDVLEWSVSIGPHLSPVGTILRRGEGLSGRVWETGEPLIVDDYQQWEGRAAIYAGYPFKATMGVPVRWRQEFLGVLNVLADPPRTFSPADAELLSLFANQAAIAIQNARLYEETRRRSLEQETVSRIAYALNTPDIHDAFPVLVKELQDLTGCDEVSLTALDEAGEQFITTVLESSFSIPGEGSAMSLSATAAAEDIAAGRPHLTADLSTETHFLLEQILHRAGLRSRVTLPLLVGGEVFGALNLGGSETGLFREDQLPVLRQIADAVALGLQNNFIFQAEREQRERAEALEEAAAIVSSTLDPDQVLDRILEQVSRVVPNDATNIMLIEGDQAHIVRWRGYERLGTEEFVSTVVFRISEVPNLHQMLESGEPIVIPDTTTHPDWVHIPGQEWLRSYAAAPIIVRDEVTGFLNVDSATPGFFTQSDTETLRAFADHAAAAIENARLFEEVEERRVYLEGVLESAPDAIVTLDAQHRIVEWNTGAEGLFGYSREEVIGRDIDPLVTNPDTIEEASEFRQIVIGGKDLLPVETIRYRKDGSPVDVRLAASPIMVGDELIGIVAVYTDMTKHKQVEGQLAYMATHDSLTGVPNRLGFFTLAEQQLKIADRTKERMLLLFADFDHLKRINDTLGHGEGDRALVEVANVLVDTFRESDIIGRIGGDEFVVLARETDEHSVEILATRLQENLEACSAKGDRRYELSLSVGVAHYDPEHPCSIDELLARGDRAMYEQKRISQKAQHDEVRSQVVARLLPVLEGASMEDRYGDGTCNRSD